MATKPKKSRRGGRPLTENDLTARGWTRVSLRLPPDVSEAMGRILTDDETPGILIRRLILEKDAKTRG
jgi:hypothetical protein